MTREARLKAEFVALYPFLGAGIWVPAAVVVDRCVAFALVPQGLKGAIRYGRPLDDDHFDFRGGARRPEVGSHAGRGVVDGPIAIRPVAGAARRLAARGTGPSSGRRPCPAGRRDPPPRVGRADPAPVSPRHARNRPDDRAGGARAGERLSGGRSHGAVDLPRSRRDVRGARWLAAGGPRGLRATQRDRSHRHDDARPGRARPLLARQRGRPSDPGDADSRAAAPVAGAAPAHRLPSPARRRSTGRRAARWCWTSRSPSPRSTTGPLLSGPGDRGADHPIGGAWPSTPTKSTARSSTNSRRLPRLRWSSWRPAASLGHRDDGPRPDRAKRRSPHRRAGVSVGQRSYRARHPRPPWVAETAARQRRGQSDSGRRDTDSDRPGVVAAPPAHHLMAIRVLRAGSAFGRRIVMIPSW